MNLQTRLQQAELDNITYIYSINIISFGKTLTKMNIRKQEITDLINFSGLLATTILDTMEIIDEAIATQKLSDSLKIVKFCHDTLMNMRVPDDKFLLQEKADLQIEATKITNIINKLLIA